MIRACRELDVRTVAVFSEADRDSLPVRLADEAVCIGPPPTARSYLNMPNIVMAPSCEGRTPSTPGPDPGREAQLRRDLRRLPGGVRRAAPGDDRAPGEEDLARQAMREAGLTVMPGSTEPVRSLDDARALADSWDTR